jgi:hypothetical protein
VSENSVICVMCSQNFHLSCLTPSCECNLASHQIVTGPSVTSNEPDEADEKLDEEEDNGSRSRSNLRGSKRTGKRTAILKDQQSTGRKFAARMYPLNRDASCEWRNQANCGGGSQPIRGCLTGTQQARHHGPDKSVANNEEGNVHRICHYCHYRWHAANNSDYDWNETSVNLHKPRPMTETEQREAVMDEMRYHATKDKKKVKD